MSSAISCSSPAEGRHESSHRWHDYRREATMAKSKTGLDHRHRDKSGRIERKHGNTKVAALRKEYGPGFAKGRRKDMMLKSLLKETGSASLHFYLTPPQKKTRPPRPRATQGKKAGGEGKGAGKKRARLSSFRSPAK